MKNQCHITQEVTGSSPVSPIITAFKGKMKTEFTINTIDYHS
jgi:hypothetical protein